MSAHFERPDIQRISQSGDIAFDMHFHTDHSYDGLASVERALQQAAQQGLNVAITDHNQVSGALQACDNELGVLVIPGIEVTSREGAHILFYFYDPGALKEFYYTEIAPCRQKNPFFISLSARQLLTLSEHYPCLVSAPHPYGAGVTGIMKHGMTREMKKRFTAVEAINGYSTRHMNRKAFRWANTGGKALTGGSDGHTVHEMGNVVTCAQASSIKEFLDALAHGNTTVVGKEENILEKLLLAALKEERYVRRAHHEHRALCLLRSQCHTECAYLLNKLSPRTLWESYIHHHS